MSPIAIAAIIMLVLLFLNVPVFASVLGACVTYFVLNPSAGLDGMLAMQRVISGIQSVPMLAIPFFVAAGALMNYCGITDRMLKFCKVLTGHMYGGLGQVNIVLSTLMGGMSGSSLADAAMEAKLLVPDMRKAGYPNGYASAITAFSSMITPLIPPGIAGIIYGSVTGTSIGRLFVAGIVPAVILCVAMMIIVSKYSKKRGIPRLSEKRASGGELWEAFKPAILPLCLPIIIIGGIRIGIFTATEAGAVAILYAAFLGFIYHEMHIKDMIQGLKETVCTTASIMLIVSAASVFSWILTKERIPQALTAWMLANIHSKYVFLIVVNIFLLIVGMFIEGNASMIILVPLLAPIAAQYGINEIQFAMIYIFNNAIGALSPPMGTLMFVTCSITKCKTAAFIKEAVPFYILLIINLMLLTWVEPFTTFLVNLFY